MPARPPTIEKRTKTERRASAIQFVACVIGGFTLRINEPVETKGSFWLPGDPETKLSGELRISEMGDVTVELTGIFGNRETGDWDLDQEGPQRILGVVEAGGAVTLDGCITGDTRRQVLSGLSVSSIHAGVAYVGAWYDAYEDVTFQEIILGVDGLDIWLATSGLGMEPDDDFRGWSIRYRLPDDIPFSLPDETEAKFVFSYTGPTFVGTTTTEATIRQTASVFLKTKQPESIGYFASLGFKLCNFLSLALDKPVSIQRLTSYADSQVDGGRSMSSQVQIFGRFGPQAENHAEIHGHEALFRYPAVAEQLDQLMGNWFRDYDLFPPAINLYFASKTRESTLLDTKVLWLAQALEALHRRTSPETEMTESEFTERLDAILASCTDDVVRVWLGEKLRYANEVTFRNRLRGLLVPFGHLFGDEKEHRDFVSQVTDTRNYLTHYDATGNTGRATNPSDLFALLRKMEALMQLHLLKRIGLDVAFIDAIVDRSWDLRDKLDRLRVRQIAPD